MDSSIRPIRKPIRSKPRVTLNPWRRHFGCSDLSRAKFVCHADWTPVRGMGDTHQRAIEAFALMVAHRVVNGLEAATFLEQLKSMSLINRPFN